MFQLASTTTLNTSRIVNIRKYCKIKGSQVHQNSKQLTILELDRKPYGYWKDKSHQREFFDQLALKLNIKNPEEWHSILRKDVTLNGGQFIVDHYGGSVLKGKS
jgi:hypothetical protein